MSKIRYKFDSKTLTYQKAGTSLKEIIGKIFSYLFIGLFLAGLIIFAAYSIWESPKEKILVRENRQLLAQYEIMNKKLSFLEELVEDMRRRDDDIYRVIFEAEPISENQRTQGVGGVNVYKNLENIANAEIVIDASKKIDMLSRKLYVQSKSYDEIFSLAKKKTEMLASIPAIQPISNKDLRRLASGFGYRTHPIYKTQHLHTGIDFSAPTGTEIYATGDGKVVYADNAGRGYGTHVILEHGYGYQTLYAHMIKMNVKKGQNVKRGDIIGFVGSTGTSTAPHLHYEVIKNQHKINPINFFFNDLSPEEYDKVIEISSQQNQSFD
jgi:murein DD-endopeptidase MepM/ murein hydrolase activator NlpD